MRRGEGRAQRGSHCCDLFEQAALNGLNGQQCRSHLTASVPSCRANAALLTGVCRPNPPGQQPASPLASRRVPAGKSDFDGSGRACITGPVASGRGGTGRRAALRALWGKPRGSSTLLGRTKLGAFRARADASRCTQSEECPGRPRLRGPFLRHRIPRGAAVSCGCPAFVGGAVSYAGAEPWCRLLAVGVRCVQENLRIDG